MSAPHITLEDAIALHQNGQLAQAKAICEQLLTTDPHCTDALHLLGVIALQANNPQDAVQLISQAIEIDASRPAFYSNRGNALLALMQFDAAIESYDNAIIIKPDFADAYFNRGNALQEVKRFEAAAESYDHAIDIKPDFAAAYCNRANVLQALSQFEKALESYDCAITIQPDFADAYFNRGDTLQKLNQLEKAVESYDCAIAVQPNHADIYFNRANALQKLECFEEAIESYDHAININPHHAGAYLNRGLTLKHLNQLNAAIESFDRAINIKPDFADAYFNRGNTLLLLKDLNASIDSFEHAIAINPQFAQAYVHRGLALKELGQFETAIESFDAAISIKPDSAEAFFSRGNAQEDLDQLAQAIDSYECAIRINPDFVEAYFQRANALKKCNDLNRAIKNYDRVIALKPDFAEAHFNRGNALSELKKLEAAVESYERAISLKPGYVGAYFNGGLVLEELKRLEKAMAYYDHVIAINPNHAEAQWSKSLLLLSTSLSSPSERNLEEGWKLYEWRSKIDGVIFHPIKIANEWDGHKIKGSLLVLTEQGLGEEIFYAGILNDLQGKAGNITAWVDPRLITLYQRSFKHINFISKKLPVNAKDYDAQIYMASLGRYFRASHEALRDNVQTPYLKSCHEKTTRLRQQLTSHKKLLCGLSWVSKNLTVGSEKSLGLRDLTSILTLPDIEFVNLQYGDTQEEQTAFYNETGVKLTQVADIDNSHDIDGLAALINACDIVLTISNTTAHLAGALGKPVIVMLPYAKGLLWYWHDGHHNNPWYPTAKLIKQHKSGDWQSMMDQIKKALNKVFTKEA